MARAKRTKVAPGAASQPLAEKEKSGNLTNKDGEKLVDLGFRVELSFRRNFKRLATDCDMSMTDLLRLGYSLAEKELIRTGRPTTGGKNGT